MLVCRGRAPISLPSTAYSKWHKDASKQVAGSRKQSSPDISLTFYFPDKRRCDLTNKAESVMDLLVDCGILEDDSWQFTGRVQLIPGGVEKDNPRVEVEYN